MGVFHPLFAQTSDVESVNRLFLSNLEQIQTYLESYCAKTQQDWCTSEIESFQQSMEEFRSIRANRAPTQIVLDNIDRMSEFAN